MKLDLCSPSGTPTQAQEGMFSYSLVAEASATWSLLQIIPDPLEYDPINPINTFAPSPGHLNGHPGNQTYRKAQTQQNIAICLRESMSPRHAPVYHLL